MTLSAMRTVALLVQSQLATALLLSPAQTPENPINVLVFGDSWGALGPSFRMLDDMFIRHGVAAVVKSTAVSGTRACQWAQTPRSLADAIDKKFDERGADFVWLTAGGNDLLEPDYLDCARQSGTFLAAQECAVNVARRVNDCVSVLLDNMWKVYKNVQIVQCAYEFQCAEGTCPPFMRWPYCHSNTTCMNVMGLAFQEQLIEPLINKYALTGKYVAFNMNGVLQEAAGMPGAGIGHPIMDQGAPCEFTIGCVHPNYGSKASVAIGEAFWNIFFSSRVQPNQPWESKRVQDFPHTPSRPQVAEVPTTPEPELPVEGLNDVDISVADTYCNWNWVPSLDDDTPPPCARQSYP